MSWKNNFNENLNYLSDQNVINRIWSKDYSLWNFNYNIDRLGWLDVLDFMIKQIDYINDIKNEIWNEGFNQIVLLGMGGSSLGAEVICNVCELEDGNPNLIVIDTMIPESINQIVEKIDLERSFFIIASKSGSTLEPLLLYKFFKDKLKKIIDDEKELGNRFLAITDEGTSLSDLALKDKFRHVLYNPSNIGGRYSVLSYFGLIPAALCGVNIECLLKRAISIKEESQLISVNDNKAASLGAYIAAMAASGKDKLTLVISGKVKKFGLWLEQLIAESSGKDGVGLIPIYDEPLVSPELYSNDRFFVYINIEDDNELDLSIQEFEDYGLPVIKFELKDKYDIGEEFFRWEFATALLGMFLNINPFDQPNGQLSKDIAARFLLEDISSLDNDLPYSFSSLSKMLSTSQPNNYLAIMAYIHNSEESNQILQSFRKKIVSDFGIATTLGYGPRVLHSTGQLHKGGPNSGLFIQITESNIKLDFDIPEENYSFGKFVYSQAFGDRLALALNARKVIHIDIGKDILSLKDMK